MRGMTAKGATDAVVDMAQVAAGILGYGLASGAIHKKWNVNVHAINAGAVIGGAVLGESAKPIRKVMIGVGGAAMAHSAIQILPASMMNGHTKNRKNLTDTQRRMIDARLKDAQRNLDQGINAGGTLNGGVNTLNGSLDDLI